MKEINLSKGVVTIVDDEDYEILNKYKWNLSSDGYAVRGVTDNGKHKVILIHRIINKTPKGLQTDHINADRLDNRKCNLRTVTVTQNNCNHPSHKGTSKYKGVSWGARAKKWIVQITTNNKLIYLGSFSEEDKAAEEYNQAALKYHGDYARLNKIN